MIYDETITQIIVIHKILKVSKKTMKSEKSLKRRRSQLNERKKQTNKLFLFCQIFAKKKKKRNKIS